MSSTTFSSLGAPADIVGRLAGRGIVDPFPIQAATVPDALAGRDICGRAPTGSGKTIAFGIPLVARVGMGSARRPRGLVLVPTRELAAQVSGELELLAGPKGPSVATVYGGVGFGAQVAKLRRGVDIVVACPGRLSDLIRQNHVMLDDVDFVVIDEADRMADMGFLPEVRRLLDSVHPSRQTLLFSATLDGDVDVLVRRYQHLPVRHELAADDTATNSRHVFWTTARAGRVGILADVIKSQWPAVVFCRTKHGADRVAKQLAQLGISAAAIHGNRTQAQRSRALAAFAAGKVQALVATDVAARGIHVDGVAVVVHFDPPASRKDYIHRSGRTGRAGQNGLVLSFVDNDQHHAALTLQHQLGLDPVVGHADIASLQQPHHPRSRPDTPKRASTSRTGSRPVTPKRHARSHSPRRRP